jgi:hypothetical protein
MTATLDSTLMAAHGAIRVGTATIGSALGGQIRHMMQATLDPHVMAAHGGIRVGTAAHGSTVGGQNRQPMQATLGPQLMAARVGPIRVGPIRAGSLGAKCAATMETTPIGPIGSLQFPISSRRFDEVACESPPHMFPLAFFLHRTFAFVCKGLLQLCHLFACGDVVPARTRLCRAPVGIRPQKHV